MISVQLYYNVTHSVIERNYAQNYSKIPYTFKRFKNSLTIHVCNEF